MYCRNCGAEVSDKAEICVKCGTKPMNATKFCWNCGTETSEAQEICVKCGVSLKKEAVATGEGKDWLTTLLLCIFVGVLGVHRFYTGHIGIGVVQLLTAGGCGIWTLIDFILILTNKFKDAQGNPLVRK